MATVNRAQTTLPKGDVYFISHGGPSTMYHTKSEAYKGWQKVGVMINESRPRGLVAVSAHWENANHSSDVIVNVDQTNPLIYDFYNFPRHYYQETFKSHGETGMIGSIKTALQDGGMVVTEENRGLDHGLWVPFKVAFEGQTDIPIVQVSLPGNSNPDSSAKLGSALSSLRDQGYTIIGTGQVVHNLRDAFGGRPTPYAEPFLNAIISALASPTPLQDTLQLFTHPLYQQAHPTPEHLLPLAVAVGATREGDVKEDVYVEKTKSGLGWGSWRWK